MYFCLLMFFCFFFYFCFCSDWRPTKCFSFRWHSVIQCLVPGCQDSRTGLCWWSRLCLPVSGHSGPCVCADAHLSLSLGALPFVFICSSVWDVIRLTSFKLSFCTFRNSTNLGKRCYLGFETGGSACVAGWRWRWLLLFMFMACEGE